MEVMASDIPLTHRFVSLTPCFVGVCFLHKPILGAE